MALAAATYFVPFKSDLLAPSPSAIHPFLLVVFVPDTPYLDRCNDINADHAARAAQASLRRMAGRPRGRPLVRLPAWHRDALQHHPPHAPPRPAQGQAGLRYVCAPSGARLRLTPPAAQSSPTLTRSSRSARWTRTTSASVSPRAPRAAAAPAHAAARQTTPRGGSWSSVTYTA